MKSETQIIISDGFRHQRTVDLLSGERLRDVTEYQPGSSKTGVRQVCLDYSEGAFHCGRREFYDGRIETFDRSGLVQVHHATAAPGCGLGS
jgi:hypothetical protein